MPFKLLITLRCSLCCCRNLDDFENLRDSLGETNAAFEANLVQMEALAVQVDHLKSNLGILAAESLKPITALMRDFAKATGQRVIVPKQDQPLEGDELLFVASIVFPVL